MIPKLNTNFMSSMIRSVAYDVKITITDIAVNLQDKVDMNVYFISWATFHS